MFTFMRRGAAGPALAQLPPQSPNFIHCHLPAMLATQFAETRNASYEQIYELLIVISTLRIALIFRILLMVPSQVCKLLGGYKLILALSRKVE